MSPMMILAGAPSANLICANKFGAGATPSESVVFDLNAFGSMACKPSSFISERIFRRPTRIPLLPNALAMRRAP